MQIEVLPHSTSQKYLGRQLTLHNPAETEVENRIAAAWRRFWTFKRELTTRSYSLKGRLRLFDGTVTPTLLYGCSSWTLTTDLENRLRRTQRQMLRMILNSPRRRRTTPTTNNDTTHSHPDAAASQDNDAASSPSSGTDTHDVDSDTPDVHIPPDADDDLEPWADWMRRCTHEAERQMTNLGIDDWVVKQRQRKWRWAAKVAMDTHKWGLHALMWNPLLDPRLNPRRRQERPKTR